mmetsp:Transcript_15937/g.25382  ORF Transcript_15937/g.25382 Transcript_15937/m.25382 type:complete len:220 (-) Transcript_15937:61-720(-)
MAISYESNYSPLAVIISVSLFSRVLGLRHSVIVGGVGQFSLNESASTNSSPGARQPEHPINSLVHGQVAVGRIWSGSEKPNVHSPLIFESPPLATSLTQLRARAKSSFARLKSYVVSEQIWILVIVLLLNISCICCVIQHGRLGRLRNEYGEDQARDDDSSSPESDKCKKVIPQRRRDRFRRFISGGSRKPTRDEDGMKKSASEDSYHSDEATRMGTSS